MNLYLDTEFHEYAHQPTVLGVPVGKPVPTIDLISLALVDEHDNTLSVLNRDCDLKAAWNNPYLRANILPHIYNKYIHGDQRNARPYTYDTLRRLFRDYGYSRAEIAERVANFVGWYKYYYFSSPNGWRWERRPGTQTPTFYAYYADYDWVVFCWLFGRMVDLPKGFPMFCVDLKQELDRQRITKEQKRVLCPDPEGEHDALVDALWNKQLHEVLLRGYGYD